MSDELQAKVEAELNKIPQRSAQDVIDAAESVKASAKKLNGVTDYPYPEEYFEWIVPYFKRFHQRDPGSIAPMVEELSQVRANVKAAGPIVQAGTETALRNWEGESASSFSRFYAAAFPDCVNNQVAVVDELRSALWLYTSILKTQREDAISIAKATVTALEGSDDIKNVEGKYQLSTVVSLTTILGIFTAFATGPIGVGVKLVGGAAGLASARIARDTAGEKPPVGATRVPEILNQMAESLKDLDQTCTDAENAIATDLEGSVTAVRKILESGNATELMQLVPNEIGDDGADASDTVDDDVANFQPAGLPEAV